LPEGGEGGDAVGGSLDDLGLVDGALGVAVGGRLVEVGQQLLSPEAEALGEGIEGGQAGTVDGGEGELEAPLGLGAIGGEVDVAEALLQAPGLGDQRVALEQLAQAPALALVEALAGP
jgi:hypothetical protein